MAQNRSPPQPRASRNSRGPTGSNANRSRPAPAPRQCLASVPATPRISLSSSRPPQHAALPGRLNAATPMAASRDIHLSPPAPVIISRYQLQPLPGVSDMSSRSLLTVTCKLVPIRSSTSWQPPSSGMSRKRPMRRSSCPAQSLNPVAPLISRL